MMKFGLECEKFLFDITQNAPSEGVYRFIDALYEQLAEDINTPKQVTNEFVLNIVEIVTRPSRSPRKILKDYLFNYLMVQAVAQRESVALAPLASMPMDYLPHLTPKWAYLVQNSILSGKKQESWMMKMDSPLRPAGNCTGIHVHLEVQTAPEFLFSGRELQDKFNFGLMLTPLIAFASSPYFFSEHGASSMRARRYYQDVYRNFPLNGGLPPVMSSSQDVLLFFMRGIEHWIGKGVEAGFTRRDLEKLTRFKGAHWNPIRWNRRWNTIELRCLDSDRVDLDAAKFIWIYGAMKRLDILGEGLQCVPLNESTPLEEAVHKALEVNGKEVTILPTAAIHVLFDRAITYGLEDELVCSYLQKLGDFAWQGLEQDYHWLFQILSERLSRKHSTSTELIKKFGKSVTSSQTHQIVTYAVDQEKSIMDNFLTHFPDVTEVVERLSLDV